MAITELPANLEKLVIELGHASEVYGYESNEGTTKSCCQSLDRLKAAHEALVEGILAAINKG